MLIIFIGSRDLIAYFIHIEPLDAEILSVVLEQVFSSVGELLLRQISSCIIDKGFLAVIIYALYNVAVIIQGIYISARAITIFRIITAFLYRNLVVPIGIGISSAHLVALHDFLAAGRSKQTILIVSEGINDGIHTIHHTSNQSSVFIIVVPIGLHPIAAPAPGHVAVDVKIIIVSNYFSVMGICRGVIAVLVAVLIVALCRKIYAAINVAANPAHLNISGPGCRCQADNQRSQHQGAF